MLSYAQLDCIGRVLATTRSQCRGRWGPEVISRTLATYLRYDLYPIYNDIFEIECHQRGDDERFRSEALDRRASFIAVRW
jgi:hypothetical protein